MVLFLLQVHWVVKLLAVIWLVMLLLTTGIFWKEEEPDTILITLVSILGIIVLYLLHFPQINAMLGFITSAQIQQGNTYTPNHPLKSR